MPAQPQTGSSILVAYDSVTGNTEKMATGVVEGAKALSANVSLKRVGEVTTEDLLSADAIIVGSPVYFANVSGAVKMSFDQWFTKYDVFAGAKMRNSIASSAD